MPITLHVAGYPHNVGGAGPHLWSLIRAWRGVGIDVCLLTKEKNDSWAPRLKALGCRFRHAKKQWEAVGPGDLVAAFCSKTFCRRAARFQERGCKIIWSGCMTFLMSEELVVHLAGRFDRVILNSAFQEQRLRKQLLSFGYTPGQLFRIPTPFWADEWSFQPKPREGPFTIGRLSRAAADKYQPDLWRLYGKIRSSIGDVRARVMAWNDKLSVHCGKPPDWADCLKASEESSEAFLHSLHCLVHRNGTARENRSRVCFEAMACGVPVLAPAGHGWPEQIEDGRTGYLCGTDEVVVARATELARDEALRLRIAGQARENLPHIANNTAIAEAWLDMMKELSREGNESDAA